MSFFFTLLDDSLKPKGSRDPLGIEVLWSSVGRKMVGNLTTVTRNLDNFVITLVGFHLCRNDKTGQTDWDAFERFEQMTGHARYRLGKEDMLGVRRVKAAGDQPILLGKAKAARILDNQKQAGLWGLYSTALTAADLANGMRRPTPRGTEVVLQLLSAGAHATSTEPWRHALDKKKTQLSESEMADLSKWVQALLNEERCRQALADALLSRDGADPWHRDLHAQAQSFVAAGSGASSPRRFLKHLTIGPNKLSDFAGRVLQFDEALALATVTFQWLLGCHGRTALEIGQKLSGMVGWPYVEPMVPSFSEIKDKTWNERADGLKAFCNAMRLGAWRGAIDALLAHHERVAKSRGGSSWCYWEDDRIKVVMNAAPGVLPAASELHDTVFDSWMASRSNDFFLEAFLTILRQSSSVPQGKPA